MLNEPIILEKPVYSSCLKNQMLCKYLEIINRYSDGLESELAKDLEELVGYAKLCGKDTGFLNGVKLASLMNNK